MSLKIISEESNERELDKDDRIISGLIEIKYPN